MRTQALARLKEAAVEKAEASTDGEAYAKKVPDGYREGKWTWAAVVSDAYGDTVLESGFSSKKVAEAWIKANKGK